MERAFHAMLVEDIPVLAEMMPSDSLAIFEAAWNASKAYEVRQAIRDYYASLAAGKNARAARDLAFLTIEEALGMSPNVEVRGDAPLYGAASLSTDGLCVEDANGKDV